MGGPGGKPTAADGDEQMMLRMYNVMRDLRVAIEDMIAEGNKVMCRNIWGWTDAASGKKMEFRDFVLWRFEIAEGWATVTTPRGSVRPKARRAWGIRSAARLPAPPRR
jgi:predicted ester cyclase